GWQAPLRVMWFSFYGYEGGGDYNKFLEEAVVHFSAGIVSPHDYTIDGRIDYSAIMMALLDILRTQRSLIVWDGAERLLAEYSEEAHLSLQTGQSSEALRCSELSVAQFLWCIASQKTSKLLLASRVPFADLREKAGVQEIPLEGLDPNSAVQFLRARGITGPSSLLEERAGDYKFHPLSLSNLVAALQADFEFQADIRADPPVDPGMPPDKRRAHV